MVATSELERAVNDRLAEHDLRYTAGRRAIVEGLKAADGPVTLPELLDSSPDLAQSSAYRNPGLLKEAGVVRRLVRDVTLETKLERTLDKAFDTLAEAEGFVTTHHTVDLYGLCSTCR